MQYKHINVKVDITDIEVHILINVFSRLNKNIYVLNLL